MADGRQRIIVPFRTPALWKHRPCGSYELLSDQMTEALAALYCPAALGPTPRPGTGLIDLPRLGTDPQLADHRLGRVHSDSGVRSLCGSIPMIMVATVSWSRRACRGEPSP